ncbi:IclR family transcriptional regulator [Paraburkholderia bannensis]|uniref:IclR family transcriptional regulator n=1 Tax=Paraburkholderia bannensis TaxID=765414 RepID=UPI002AB676CD|nr:IclR family transcriptional regulator [Paraburkholderia bannensis]
MKEKESGEDRSGGIQVIARTARILNALSDSPGGMSLAEIASAADLPRSTVHRIVNALGQENIVQADRSDGVRLGPALLRLVARVHTDVVSIVTPHLEQLGKDVEETVTLSRMSGKDLAFIHVMVAEQVLRVMPRVGADLPLYSTSGGRALLALHSDADIKTLLGSRYPKLTDKTIHTFAELAHAVERIRATGYEWEEEETNVGVSSLSVALDSVLGRYAISIVLPAARVNEKREMLATRLLELKNTIQTEIGRSHGEPQA